MYELVDIMRQKDDLAFAQLLNRLRLNEMTEEDKQVFTLQEMCCGFLLSREMWYRKSVLPGTGAG